jgi:hypothetical protein
MVQWVDLLTSAYRLGHVYEAHHTVAVDTLLVKDMEMTTPSTLHVLSSTRHTQIHSAANPDTAPDEAELQADTLFSCSSAHHSQQTDSLDIVSKEATSTSTIPSTCPHSVATTVSLSPARLLLKEDSSCDFSV